MIVIVAVIILLFVAISWLLS